jgi:hypothetical protein
MRKVIYERRLHDNTLESYRYGVMICLEDIGSNVHCEAVII